VRIGIGLSLTRLSGGAGASPSSLLTGLAAYWTMDEASGARADSAGGGYALAENGAVGQAAGKIGSAASFDGAEANYLSRSGAFLPTDALAVSLWVNVTTAVGFDMFAGAPTTGSWVNGWGLFYSGAFMAFVGTNADFISAGVPSAGWHHALLNWDGATTEFFWDGASQGTQAKVGAIANGTMTVGFGDSGGSPVALIDELGVWSRALTADEIAALYNAGAGTTYPFS